MHDAMTCTRLLTGAGSSRPAHLRAVNIDDANLECIFWRLHCGFLFLSQYQSPKSKGQIRDSDQSLSIKGGKGWSLSRVACGPGAVRAELELVTRDS